MSASTMTTWKMKMYPSSLMMIVAVQHVRRASIYNFLRSRTMCVVMVAVAMRRLKSPTSVGVSLAYKRVAIVFG